MTELCPIDNGGGHTYHIYKGHLISIIFQHSKITKTKVEVDLINSR